MYFGKENSGASSANVVLRSRFYFDVNPPSTTIVAPLTNDESSEAMTFGPRTERIHSFDQWVSIDSTVKTAETIAATLIDWCGV